jgi:hypothetical protein
MFLLRKCNRDKRRNHDQRSEVANAPESASAPK